MRPSDTWGVTIWTRKLFFEFTARLAAQPLGKVSFDHEVSTSPPITQDSIYSTSIYSVVREINQINQRELELGVSGSWHDEYKGAWFRNVSLVILTWSLP
jgi:hypothetical protein